MIDLRCFLHCCLGSVGHLVKSREVTKHHMTLERNKDVEIMRSRKDRNKTTCAKRENGTNTLLRLYLETTAERFTLGRTGLIDPILVLIGPIGSPGSIHIGPMLGLFAPLELMGPPWAPLFPRSPMDHISLMGPVGPTGPQRAHGQNKLPPEAYRPINS